MNEEETKRVLKEAIKEWLDEKFTQFGKWTMTGVAAAALAFLIYGILRSQGWHR